MTCDADPLRTESLPVVLLLPESTDFGAFSSPFHPPGFDQGVRYSARFVWSHQTLVILSLIIHLVSIQN